MDGIPFSQTKMSFGLTGKYIRSKIIETAQGGAVDFGVSLQAWDPLWLSLSGQNFGTKIKFNKENEQLPMNVRLGVAYKPKEPYLSTLDINFPWDNDPYIAAGLEYRRPITTQTWIAGRTGYRSRTDYSLGLLSGFSFGVGFGWNAYGLDFAWVPFGALGNTYRFSLSAHF